MRSECSGVAMSKFDFTWNISETEAVTPESLCADASNTTLQGQVCAHTPISACKAMATSLGAECGAEVSGCEPIGEVDELSTGACQEDADTATDHFIRTYDGCKKAVEQYGADNLETLQAAMDETSKNWWRKPTVTVKFSGKSR